jgi:hypothetical protein
MPVLATTLTKTAPAAKSKDEISSEFEPDIEKKHG